MFIHVQNWKVGVSIYCPNTENVNVPVPVQNGFLSFLFFAKLTVAWLQTENTSAPQRAGLHIPTTKWAPAAPLLGSKGILS
jgi:hypothetical protein